MSKYSISNHIVSKCIEECKSYYAYRDDRSEPIQYLEIQEPDSAKTIGTLFPAVSSPHDPSLLLLTNACLPPVYGPTIRFQVLGVLLRRCWKGGSGEKSTLSFDDIKE
jgi:hypothetical protein